MCMYGVVSRSDLTGSMHEFESVQVCVCECFNFITPAPRQATDPLQER